jgi:beta-glucosidase
VTVADTEVDATNLAARFPPGFAFGTATAAYQIEGSVAADGRLPSIWDTFSHTPGRTLNGDSGDDACDHYRRWASDLDLMASLGLRAYRFSVAWPRVQPAGSGGANVQGLDFYDRLVEGLLERGIDPWLTLYHWDLPQALQDRGGWSDPSIVERFAEYVGLVADRLGDRVRHWITLNESRTHAFIGHGTGRHAPGIADWQTALRVAHHEHLAHAAAVRVLRQTAPGARVGICHDTAGIRPATPDPADVEAARRYGLAIHDWFFGPSMGRGYPRELADWYAAQGLLPAIDLDAVAAAEPIDFLAVNYYKLERIHAAPPEPTWGFGARGLDGVGELAGNGWEIWPEALTDVLRDIHDAYQPPALVVSENGAAFADTVGPDGSVDDTGRRSYIARHLDAAAKAIEAGVPLVGYFAWSLLDNFEWALGYGTRFGIVHVDFETQARTIKASGHWYRSLIEAAT